MTDNSTTVLPAEEQPAPLAARAPVRPDSPAFSDFDDPPGDRRSHWPMWAS